MRKLDPLLHDRIKTLINSMGYEFVGAEMLPESGRMVFRVYIDGLDASPQKGVTVDDCSKVSQQVGAMLDVEELIQGRYLLEVSSPGLDRQLFELTHYLRFVGSRIAVTLHIPIEGRRKFKGQLVRVEGEDIYLLPDDTEHELKLSFSGIEKANLIANIRF